MRISVKEKFICFLIVFLTAIGLSVIMTNQAYAEDSVTVNGIAYSALTSSSTIIPEDLINADHRDVKTTVEDGKSYLTDLTGQKITGFVYHPSQGATVYYDGQGTWNYYQDGLLDTTYTGLVETIGDNYYYVHAGSIDFNFSGVLMLDGKNYQIKNGKKISKIADGLNEINGKLYYYQNGKLDTSYSGLALYNNKWYKISNGEHDYTFTGLTKYDGTFYYVKDGVVD